MRPPDVTATPFRLGPQDAHRGALVLHGFTGTPFEMRLLGENLAQTGWLVDGPLLAGHGRDTAALAATGWPDWYATAEAALTTLAARCRTVAVCGLSMGGLLTLELARRHSDKIAAIAVMAAPLWLSRRAVRFATFTAHAPWLSGASMPKLSGSDIRDPELRAANQRAQGRAGMPFSSLYSLVELGEHVRAGLKEVQTPALLVHSREDHTVPFACMDAIARGISSTEVRRLVLERSFHVVTLDVERERLFGAVRDHLARHL